MWLDWTDGRLLGEFKLRPWGTATTTRLGPFRPLADELAWHTPQQTLVYRCLAHGEQ